MNGKAGSLTKPVLVSLPKFLDVRGNLSFMEEESQIPFKIRRVYWIYDVPGGEQRGGHAFIATEEIIVALSGSFDLNLHDGVSDYHFHLNRSYNAVLVPRMYWRMMDNFSTNSLALVVASTDYSEEDYIRSFNDFITKRQDEISRF